jgi:hypothetical protein
MHSISIPVMTICLFLISLSFLFCKQSRQNLFSRLFPEKSKSLEGYKYAPSALAFFSLAILPATAAYFSHSFYVYNHVLIPLIIFMFINDFRVELIKEVRASI